MGLKDCLTDFGVEEELDAQGIFEYLQNNFIEEVKVRLTEYSYNHQIPIKVNVQETVKYLGDNEDPSQYEAEELVGKNASIRIKLKLWESMAIIPGRC